MQVGRCPHRSGEPFDAALAGGKAHVVALGQVDRRGLTRIGRWGPGRRTDRVAGPSARCHPGGFYWHFDDRGALLDEMLDRWERATTDALIERVEGEGGDPRTKLRRLFALALSGDGVSTGITTDLAVRDWSRREQNVADRLRRVDNRRMEYLRSLYGAFCPDPRTSRPAPCCPFLSSSATTSSPPIMGRAATRTYWISR